jgi:hypothetical protein
LIVVHAVIHILAVLKPEETGLDRPLLSYIFKASLNTIDQSFRRGCQMLGLKESRRHPTALLAEAEALSVGVGADPVHRQVTRRLVDALRSDPAFEDWLKRFMEAEEVGKKAQRELRRADKDWKAFAAHLDELPHASPTWRPDLEALKRQAIPLGLEWVQIPTTHDKLSWEKMLEKASKRCNINRREAWRDYLERTGAPSSALRLLDQYGEAADNYTELRRKYKRMMGSLLKSAPHSAVLQDARQEFIDLVEMLGRSRKG